jgi:hypothetical protein
MPKHEESTAFRLHRTPAGFIETVYGFRIKEFEDYPQQAKILATLTKEPKVLGESG